MMARAGYEADKLRIMVQQWPQAARELTSAWDVSPNELVWSTNSKVLYATAQAFGQQSLFAIDVATGDSESAAREGHGQRTRAREDRGGRAVAVLVDDSLPRRGAGRVEADASAGAPVVRTSFNKDWLAAVSMGEAEQFTFTGWNNETVHGYVVKPAGLRSRQEVPGRVPDPRRPAGQLRQ